MATHPMRMANTTMVLIPSHYANINQADQGIPSTVIQQSGMVQYEGHQLGGPSNQSQQDPQMGAMEKFHCVETKTLGAVQILIGLIHIGFGAVAICLFHLGYHPIAATGGYPFWGGLFFITSGSLSVSTEKYPNASMVKCCVGMNITSAIIALIGIILCLTELVINKLNPAFGEENLHHVTSRIGTGLCVLFFLFTMLEFCITVLTAHFGCRATCCNNGVTMTFMQYTVVRGGASATEGNSAPPSDYAALSPRQEMSGCWGGLQNASRHNRHFLATSSTTFIFCFFVRLKAENQLRSVIYPKTTPSATLSYEFACLLVCCADSLGMATDPVKMPNGIVVFIPSNHASLIQPGQDVAGAVMQCVQYGNLSNPPQQTSRNRALAKCLKVEAKTLGAIQIIIGLIHIGFGAVPGILLALEYMPVATVRGYPFWGGIFFIVSGSVTVAAEKHVNGCLMKCSVGLNITSAIMALSGIILYIVELVLNRRGGFSVYSPHEASKLRYFEAQSTGVALAVLLLLFSLMEFCITVMIAHFGCQANCCTNDTAIAYLPCAVTGESVALTENNPAPSAYNPAPSAYNPAPSAYNPAYSNVVVSPQSEI
ncbi:uncharacterized protein LOC133377962 [Rhineura floridana]|uniref:uncharacterized protein LOC133377962 n=1 Tax=Rhineura floridana TaxID=261503 RepID=UPI002AC80BD3|nr:uncharacterized protein LOC133377962 [Rhineura floridana]